MRLRRFNEEGLRKFHEFLDRLEHEPARLVPREILEDDRLTEIASSSCEVEERGFDSRLHAAEYLNGIFAAAELSEVETDGLLWSWLSLFFFDQLCPRKASGHRNPLERARYIADPGNFQRYYRHLLLGPYKIYRAYSDNPRRALALLCRPLHIIDDIVGQLAASQEIVSNRTVIEVATWLYVDPQTHQPKRGAGGKGAGSPRRYSEILGQLDLTRDLYALEPDELIAILPKEFDRFNSSVRN